MTRSRNLPTSGVAGLGFAFVRDLERDYREHGAEMISQFRKNEPRNYLRLLKSIAPQDVNAKEHWLDQLTDEQIATLLRLAKEALAAGSDETIASPP
jgi:hypothetical protein